MMNCYIILWLIHFSSRALFPVMFLKVSFFLHFFFPVVFVTSVSCTTSHMLLRTPFPWSTPQPPNKDSPSVLSNVNCSQVVTGLPFTLLAHSCALLGHILKKFPKKWCVECKFSQLLHIWKWIESTSHLIDRLGGYRIPGSKSFSIRIIKILFHCFHATHVFIEKLNTILSNTALSISSFVFREKC